MLAGNDSTLVGFQMRKRMRHWSQVLAPAASRPLRDVSPSAVRSALRRRSARRKLGGT